MPRISRKYHTNLLAGLGMLLPVAALLAALPQGRFPLEYMTAGEPKAGGLLLIVMSVAALAYLKYVGLFSWSSFKTELYSLCAGRLRPKALGRQARTLLPQYGITNASVAAFAAATAAILFVSLVTYRGMGSNSLLIAAQLVSTILSIIGTAATVWTVVNRRMLWSLAYQAITAVCIVLATAAYWYDFRLEHGSRYAMRWLVTIDEKAAWMGMFDAGILLVLGSIIYCLHLRRTESYMVPGVGPIRLEVGAEHENP